ncbi:thioredoxin domain-containing protein [Candidatus Uhrbacteria bacterium]|nr:thioredoxin domain-containing protein [Candidatus Uhrbacteria bacterium]
MRNRWLALLLVGFLALITLVFFALRIKPIDLEKSKAAQEATSTPITQPSVTFVNPSRGAENPKLTLIEFADFQCEHCMTLDSALQVALHTYPNEVRLVWKDLPNPSAHEQAIPAAIAAHCADRQGLFWPYHDALMARQSILSTDQYLQIARELKLDMDRFNNCFSDQDTMPIVEKDIQEGRALGIVATPTLFVGSQKIVGSITSEELLQIIQTELTQP